MMRRIVVWMAALGVLGPAAADAEWQVKPFVAVTFAPFTTYIDPDLAAGSVDDAGSAHPAFGVGVVLLGDVLGVEGEFTQVPGFFEKDDRRLLGGDPLVANSSVQTISGSVIVAVPERLSRYTLRPYAVAGLGTMSVRIEGPPPFSINVRDRVVALNVGGGAAGFFNERAGVAWELRHFRAVGAEPGVILFEDAQLSFWRANMALVLRY